MKYVLKLHYTDVDEPTKHNPYRRETIEKIKHQLTNL